MIAKFMDYWLLAIGGGSSLVGESYWQSKGPGIESTLRGPGIEST